MKRLALLSLPALVAAGCVVTTREYVPAPVQEPPPPAPVVVAPQPPPPPPALRVFYGGQHMIPAAMGGGWCYLSGPHEPDYWTGHLDY